MKRARAKRHHTRVAAPVSRSRAVWLRAAIIVAAGLVCYWNSLSNPFVLDDRVTVVENPTIRHLSLATLAPPRQTAMAGRPLVNATLAVNYALSGFATRGYHATNLAIHLACALVLMGVIRRTLDVSKPPIVSAGAVQNVSFAVALLWVVHPLNSDVINYVTQRTEALMALALFATLYLSGRAHASSMPRRWQALAVATCALGMACKESMVVAPVLVLLCDGWLIQAGVGQAFRARRTFYGLLASTWLVLLALNWGGPRARSAGFSTGVNPWTYLLNQAPLILGYLRRAVWPRDLVALYGPPRAIGFGDVWMAAIVLAAAGIATVVALRRRCVPGVLGAWFFITLAPASSIVPISTEVGAERRMYVPLVAVLALSVWTVGVLAARWRAARREVATAQRATDAAAIGTGGGSRMVPAAVIAAAVAGLGFLTVVRNAEFSSPGRLAQTVLDRRPTGYASHMMGEALLLEGRTDDAIPFLRDAIADSPTAQYSIGTVYFNRGDYEKAFQELDAFVRAQPVLAEVVPARMMLGQILASQQRWPEAIAQFRTVLRMRPRDPNAQRALAQALFSSELFDEAIVAYRTYLESTPNDIDARSNLAVALVATGKPDDAIAQFTRNVEENPAHVASQVNLARALYDARRPDEALPHAERAVALDGTSPASFDLLGRILAVLGRYDEARQAFERALLVDPSFSDARDNLGRLDRLVRIAPARR